MGLYRRLGLCVSLREEPPEHPSGERLPWQGPSGCKWGLCSTTVRRQITVNYQSLNWSVLDVKDFGVELHGCLSPERLP
jgi:hypothetical protein